MHLIRFCFIIKIAACIIFLFSRVSLSQTNVDIYTNIHNDVKEENNNQNNNTLIFNINESNGEYTEELIRTNGNKSKDQIENNKKTFKKLDYLDYVWRSAACPGFGQYYLKRMPKAIFFYSAFVASGTLGLVYHFKGENTYQEYLSKQDTKEVTQIYDDYLLQNQAANTFFYITLGVWLCNIFDIAMDVRWINMNSIDIQKEGRKVSMDINSKEVYFYVYKKMF